MYLTNCLTWLQTDLLNIPFISTKSAFAIRHTCARRDVSSHLRTRFPGKGSKRVRRNLSLDCNVPRIQLDQIRFGMAAAHYLANPNDSHGRFRAKRKRQLHERSSRWITSEQCLEQRWTPTLAHCATLVLDDAREHFLGCDGNSVEKVACGSGSDMLAPRELLGYCSEIFGVLLQILLEYMIIW